MRRLPLVLVLAVLASGCGGSGGGAGAPTETASPGGSDKIVRNSANAAVRLTIGSKNFTEQRVLGEIYAQGLQAAGYTISKELNLGDEKAALAALKADEISAYPEYTGTALLSFFGKKASELPADPQAAYELARKDFAAQGMTALEPTPFTSSNEVAVTKATAERLHLKTISDLAGKAQELTLYGSPECRHRLDCLVGLEQVYGLHFKRFVPVAIPHRHDVLRSGRADVSIVFTTDPQIHRENEVLLEDDRNMFPPYNSMLVMKQTTAAKAGPDLAQAVDLIQEQLTDENMQELNARVDLDRKDPAEVAREYLTETGLI